MDSSLPNKSKKCNVQLTMDYDSGYMSHHQESNSDTSMEGPAIERSPKKELIYLSEDALLEKPNINELNTRNLDLSVEICNEDYEETRQLFFSSPDLLSSSVISEKSTYSGLENESELSIEIPECERIVVDLKALEENKNEEISTDLCGDDGSPILLESRILREKNAAKIMENIIQDKPSIPESILPVKKKLTLVFSKKEENNYSVKRKYPSISPMKRLSLTPQNIIESPQKSVTKTLKLDNLTPDKKTVPLNSYISPDLFEEEEKLIVSTNEVVYPPDFISEEKFIVKKDQRLIKRAQNNLSGVLPPPSVTIMHMSVVEMLQKIENGKEYFWDKKVENVTKTESKTDANASLNSSTESADGFKSLLENIETSAEFDKKEFPEIMNYRFHGLHHNRSKLSEEFEDLCEKYARRFVGAETQSSCTAFAHTGTTGSPSKRKDGLRWQAKSPGRRLSHLARRRITFSNSNLNVAGAAGSRARQILVDARKLDLLNRRKSPRKSPRKTPRKTPRKSPRLSKTRTPSSSAKKKLAMRFRELTGEIEKSIPSTSSETKNILASPALSESSRSSLSSCSSLPIKRELFPSQSKEAGAAPQDGSRLRRALFASPPKLRRSPLKRSPMKLFGREKRKRSESEDAAGVGRETKVARSQLGVDKEGGVASRPAPAEMNDMQKKRLQWAVYEALRSQNVTTGHPQFKTFASVLARVTRHFLGTQPMAASGGNQMLKIAKTHAFSVARGRSVDEVLYEYSRSRSARRDQLSQGVSETQVTSTTKRDTVLQDRSNTMESWEKRKLEQLGKSKGVENRVDRIRKVINFDNR